MTTTPICRHHLASMKRIVVKVGTSAVCSKDGTASLDRLGSIVEQISHLVELGKQIIFVTSGSVGLGSQVLAQTNRLNPLQNPAVLHPDLKEMTFREMRVSIPRACSAAGQYHLMSLYDDLFARKNIQCAQILLTDADFRGPARAQLCNTIEILLKLGIVPILNENDVVSTRQEANRDESNKLFWDNDSLAALVASEMKSDILLLLTDVNGLLTAHPSNKDSKLISVYTPGLEFTVGAKSQVGRGGMKSKIDAATFAVGSGVKAVVIGSAYKRGTILDIIAGKQEGTLFVKHPQRAYILSAKL